MVEHLVDVEEDPVRFWAGPLFSEEKMAINNTPYQVAGYIKYVCKIETEEGKMQFPNGRKSA